MPEEEFLDSITALKRICEAEDVILVGEFEQIQELGRGFHDRKGRTLSVVDDDRDSS
jgi:hypothetical protein